jgi:hypothetical protein
LKSFTCPEKQNSLYSLMKISTTLLLSASLFCFLGCTEDKKQTAGETATAENIANPEPAPIKAEITDLDADNLQASLEFNEAPPTADAPVPAPVATAPGLNPPHGQPGHDCAIAVGAPLNSKGNAAPVQPVSPMGAPTLSVPAISNTAPGLNPPHGQPGHDCAIAVGAPLRK